MRRDRIHKHFQKEQKIFNWERYKVLKIYSKIVSKHASGLEFINTLKRNKQYFIGKGIM